MTDKLFSSVRIARTATPEELTALDAEIGGLPPSYRVFAKQYGAGLTNGLIRIFMPFSSAAGLFQSEGEGLIDILNDFVADWIADGRAPGKEDCLEPYDQQSVGVAARYKDLIFFAKSENGESFCWLRTDDCYRFYVLDRAFLSLRYGGDDLMTLIGDMQTDKVKTILGTGYEPLPSSFVGYA